MSKMTALAAALLSTVLLISCSNVAPRVEVDREALELEDRPELPGPSNPARAAFIVQTEEWGEAAIATHAATLDILCRVAVCIGPQ